LFVVVVAVAAAVVDVVVNVDGDFLFV